MRTSDQLPDHDTFYQILTAHHAGLIDDASQQRLRESRVLVAGCGVVGRRAASHLTRAGVEHFCLADDRVVTERHLPWFGGGFEILGRSFAQVLGERLKGINPFAHHNVHDQTVTESALAPYIGSADLIVDALGVENADDYLARWRVHRAAHEAQVPVVTGFDVGSSVWVLIYDYRDPRQAILGNAYSPEDLAESRAETAIPVLLNLMSLSKSQPEVLRETERILLGQRDHLPRSAAASDLAGSLIAQTGIDILLGKPVRAAIAVDLEEMIQPPGGLRKTGRKLAALYSLRRHLRHRRRNGRVGVFSPLEDEVFQDLRPYMEERTYEAGSVIVRQGDGADEFFVILEGQVAIEYEERDEDDEAQEYTIIAELGPGDYFGEMALLTDSPRTASVVVEERCRVLVLSRGAFEMYLEESDAADRKVRGEALARLRENTSFIGC